MKKILAASIGVERVDNTTRIGGYTNFDTTNRFQYYDDLIDTNPHVSTSIWKLGLSLTKDMYFEGRRGIVSDFENWSDEVNFVDQVQTIAYRLAVYGTDVSLYQGNADDFYIIPLLMSKTTLLPEGIRPGSTPRNIMKPPIIRAVVNESDAATRITYDPDEFLYGAWNRYRKIQKDVNGRDTYGIYGSSLLDPIIITIRSLLSVNDGYVKFVEKYGSGRYFVSFDLQDAIVKGDITFEEAQKMVKEWEENHQHLKQNEDLVGIGLDVESLDANGTLDVLAFKKSLETDIQIGLFQSPLSMGDAKGSTYAAGYVSEEDRMLVLEGLQRSVRNIVQKAINKRLELMKKPKNTVTVHFEELSRPKLESRDMIELFHSGGISKRAMYEYFGLKYDRDDGE